MFNDFMMNVTVYTENGYEILHNVVEVTKTKDGKKYRVRMLETTEMGTDFTSNYYKVHDTEIHIG